MQSWSTRHCFVSASNTKLQAGSAAPAAPGTSPNAPQRRASPRDVLVVPIGYAKQTRSTAKGQGCFVNLKNDAEVGTRAFMCVRCTPKTAKVVRPGRLPRGRPTLRENTPKERPRPAARAPFNTTLAAKCRPRARTRPRAQRQASQRWARAKTAAISLPRAEFNLRTLPWVALFGSRVSALGVARPPRRGLLAANPWWREGSRRRGPLGPPARQGPRSTAGVAGPEKRTTLVTSS